VKPKISLVTLGVSDVERAKRFYRDGLGLPLAVEAPEVAMFRMEGTWLAVYAMEELAAEVRAEPLPAGFRGLALAHNVERREGVDQMISEAVAAGGSVVTPPRDTSWGGYAGYFADPDGHLWEVAWNPGLELT
jgi:catechol 2,3-dioxygenase-like lactoylglutathione lyase family enzyme